MAKMSKGDASTGTGQFNGSTGTKAMPVRGSSTKNEGVFKGGGGKKPSK